MTSLLRGLGAAVGLSSLIFLQKKRPLRQPTQPFTRRLLRNLVMAASAGLTVATVERPVVKPLAAKVKRQRLGLLGKLSLPPPLETAVAVLLMDYTLFVWHYLTHRVPWLWRFHLPHHVDLDMDSSTALRFHFGELALSTLWRAAQVRLIGVSPEALGRWQGLTTASILFHHANLRLPRKLDGWLSAVVVTPRMHDVHHSRVPEEMNGNWSSGLSLWDRLHGTLNTKRTDAIGVPTFDREAQVTLGKILILPLRPSPEPG